MEKKNEITKNELVELVKEQSPIFGTLEVIENTDAEHKTITFRDSNAKTTIENPVKKSENLEVDVSSDLITIVLGEENTIDIIEHGFTIFTEDNKEAVLAYTSLIGKTLV